MQRPAPPNNRPKVRVSIELTHHTAHSTQNPAPSSQHTAHSTQHPAPSIQHTAQSTQHTPCCHSAQCSIHTTPCKGYKWNGIGNVNVTLAYEFGPTAGALPSSILHKHWCHTRARHRISARTYLVLEFRCSAQLLIATLCQQQGKRLTQNGDTPGSLSTL